MPAPEMEVGLRLSCTSVLVTRRHLSVSTRGSSSTINSSSGRASGRSATVAAVAFLLVESTPVVVVGSWEGYLSYPLRHRLSACISRPLRVGCHQQQHQPQQLRSSSKASPPQPQAFFSSSPPFVSPPLHPTFPPALFLSLPLFNA